VIGRPPVPAIDRFWKYVMPVPFSGCWIWMGSLENTGYSHFRHTLSKGQTGHSFAYRHYRGAVPPGMHLDHKCRVPSCVNPDHLEVVTCQENILRGVGLAAMNARKTHCKRGHEFAGDNIYHRNGTRQCRECVLELQRQRRARL
jgi:hypothetical protein